jgi:hypothetical protein
VVTNHNFAQSIPRRELKLASPLNFGASTADDEDVSDERAIEEKAREHWRRLSHRPHKAANAPSAVLGAVTHLGHIGNERDRVALILAKPAGGNHRKKADIDVVVKFLMRLDNAFFNAMNLEMLVRVAKVLHLEVAHPMQVLAREGEPAEKLYVIMQGVVSLWTSRAAATAADIAAQSKQARAVRQKKKTQRLRVEQRRLRSANQLSVGGGASSSGGPESGNNNNPRRGHLRRSRPRGGKDSDKDKDADATTDTAATLSASSASAASSSASASSASASSASHRRRRRRRRGHRRARRHHRHGVARGDARVHRQPRPPHGSGPQAAFNGHLSLMDGKAAFSGKFGDLRTVDLGGEGHCQFRVLSDIASGDGGANYRAVRHRVGACLRTPVLRAHGVAV